MNFLRNFLDKQKPKFEKGGKFSAFRSVFTGFEAFLFVPDHTAKSGSNIRDAVDLKRTMIVVVLALVPALLFGMYNVGYQHFLATGTLETTSLWHTFFSCRVSLTFVKYSSRRSIMISPFLADYISFGFLC